MGSNSRSRLESRSSWKDVPDELLEIISKLLKTKTDVSRFRATCKSWRSSIPDPFHDPSSNLHLTLTFKYQAEWKHVTYHWVVTKTILYHVTPSNSNYNYNYSSSWSWLLNLKEVEHSRFLISHPSSSSSSSSMPKVINSLDFRVSELCTLSYTIDRHYRSHRESVGVILSSRLEDNPNSLLLLRYDHYQRRRRPRRRQPYRFYIKSNKWWRPAHSDTRRLLCCNADVISYGGKFCILHKNGNAFTVDSSLENKVIEIAYALPIQKCYTCDYKNYGYDHDKHLVDLCNGELLLVDICVHGSTRKNSRNCIKVFKLNPEEKRWVEVKSLDGRILFIGWDYISFSVFASDFPGCKANCICIASYWDPFVYDLVDASLLPADQILHYTNLFLPPWNRTSNVTEDILLANKDEI